MPVEDFLKKVENLRSVAVGATVLDALWLMDEYGPKPCSTLAADIRKQMTIDTQKNKSAASKRSLSPLELHREAAARRAKEEKLKKKPKKHSV